MIEEEKRIKKISIPHIGTYSRGIVEEIQKILEKEGIKHLEFILAAPTTKKTVMRGWQLMDENMCLPAKITLGNMLEALDQQGVNSILMWDSCGTCRYKVYHILHRNILKRLGYKVKMYRFRGWHAFSDLQAVDPAITKKVVLKVLWRGLWRIWNEDKKLLQHQSRIPKDKPKIGIVGEIYTILDPNANLQLLEKLEKNGVFIHNSLPLSEYVFKMLWHKPFFRKLGFKRPDINYKILEEAKREAENYLPKYTVGGHGKESIINTIYYAKMGFDGIIHVQPFPCMPESTVSEFLDEISEDYHTPVNHLTFDQHFGEANLNTRIEATVNMLRMGKDFKQFSQKKIWRTVQPRPLLVVPVNNNQEKFYLGVDVGSVSTKGVIMNQEGEIMDSFYLDTARDPIRAIQRGLKQLKDKVKNKHWNIVATATTGSGRELAATILGADVAVDEITCQTLGAIRYVPEVRTIIEIGGQDSKFIQIDENGVPIWFNLNTICSAGTGSFFMGAAREFGLSIEEFGQIAKNSEREVRITGRCGVFAESDMVTKQQQGYSKEALIRGMCMAMPQNFLNNVARNRNIKEPVVFTGGVASNPGAVEGFEKILKKKVQVLPYNKISGAIGACLYAQSKINKEKSNFKGLEISEANFQRKGFICPDCPNQCEISLLLKDGQILAAFGSRCRKWEALTGKLASVETINNKGWHDLLV